MCQASRTSSNSSGQPWACRIARAALRRGSHDLPDPLPNRRHRPRNGPVKEPLQWITDSQMARRSRLRRARHRKTMSAVSNANPAVATLEAAHGIVENDIIVVASGWSSSMAASSRPAPSTPTTSISAPSICRATPTDSAWRRHRMRSEVTAGRRSHRLLVSIPLVVNRTSTHFSFSKTTTNARSRQADLRSRPRLRLLTIPAAHGMPWSMLPTKRVPPFRCGSTCETDRRSTTTPLSRSTARRASPSTRS